MNTFLGGFTLISLSVIERPIRPSFDGRSFAGQRRNRN